MNCTIFNLVATSSRTFTCSFSWTFVNVDSLWVSMNVNPSTNCLVTACLVTALATVSAAAIERCLGEALAISHPMAFLATILAQSTFFGTCSFACALRDSQRIASSPSTTGFLRAHLRSWATSRRSRQDVHPAGLLRYLCEDAALDVHPLRDCTVEFLGSNEPGCRSCDVTLCHLTAPCGSKRRVSPLQAAQPSLSAVLYEVERLAVRHLRESARVSRFRARSQEVLRWLCTFT